MFVYNAVFSAVKVFGSAGVRSACFVFNNNRQFTVEGGQGGEPRVRKTFLLILLLSVAWDWTEEGGRSSLCDGDSRIPMLGSVLNCIHVNTALPHSSLQKGRC